LTEISSLSSKNATEEKIFIYGTESKNSNIFIKDYLLGGWEKLKDNLLDAGINFELVYKADLFSNFYGGKARGTKYFDNFDFIFAFDLNELLNWSNTFFTAHVLGNNGEGINEIIGSAQGVSNIETIPAWKLYQFLIEKKFFDNQFSLLIGLYDFNSEFDSRETSALFINPAHGIGGDISKSGLNGPSIFPTTSATIRIKYEFENNNYLQAALLDGVPGHLEKPDRTYIVFNKNDGFLIASEFGIVKSEDAILDYKIALGGWIYTSKSEGKKFTENNEVQLSYEQNYGIYLTSEKLLYSKEANAEKGLSGFFRIGYANTSVNPVDFYMGMGCKYAGLFDKREDDEFGIAVAISHNAKSFRRAALIIESIEIKPFELNIEAIYSFQLTPWLILQPDIQYIINPCYSTSSKSAFVGGVRLGIVL
jgi:porin